MKATVFAVCLIVLTACGGTPEPEATAPTGAMTPTDAATEVEVSPRCDAAMAAAAKDAGDDVEEEARVANPLVIATLSECATAGEWLAAVHDYPGAVPVTDPSALGIPDFGDLDLEGICAGNEEDPVCVDAVSKGHIRGRV